jgi:hypothetical protein
MLLFLRISLRKAKKTGFLGGKGGVISTFGGEKEIGGLGIKGVLGVLDSPISTIR